MEDLQQPVLSYKKTSRKNRQVSTPTTPISADFGPQELASPVTSLPAGTPTTRKVSSRRKALQDFYKMNEAEAQVSTEPQTGLGIEEGPKLPNLDTRKAIDEFLKRASLKDILLARNAAADQLSLHDSEKKAIIYDNYSELIKLNDVLGGINTHVVVDEFSEAPGLSNDAIDASLAELSLFLENDAAVFNNDFPTVLETLCEQHDTDSAASIRAIA